MAPLLSLQLLEHGQAASRSSSPGVGTPCDVEPPSLSSPAAVELGSRLAKVSNASFLSLLLSLYSQFLFET
jgi:hypothetical protein